MLEEYLSQLQQEGQVQAQDQNFSLDLSAQARKLSRFQFQQPALWLLKMVQAAVASAAPEIRITCTRDTLEARFTPRWDQAIEFGPREAPWIQHLHWGLLAALSVDSTALELSWREQTLFSRGQTPPAAGPEVRLYLRRRPRPFWHFIDPVRAQIAKTLAERCALCPIPVRLDQRVLNGLLPEQAPFALKPVKPANMEVALRNYYWLAERSWLAESGQGRFALAPPGHRPAFVVELLKANCPLLKWSFAPVSCTHWMDLDLPVLELSKTDSTAGLLVLGMGRDNPDASASVITLRALRPSPELLTPVSVSIRGFKQSLSSMACRRWLGLAAQSQRPGQLAYLADGVLLDPIDSLSTHPGTCAIIADSPVETDLSQLQVVVNQVVETDRAWLRQEESRLLRLAQPIFVPTNEGERRLVPVSIREHWRNRIR